MNDAEKRHAELEDITAEYVQLLAAAEARVADLERQLGILHESDGREARIGVTAQAVAQLRDIAERGHAPEEVLTALRVSIRHYDLTRKAWLKSNDEYGEIEDLLRDVQLLHSRALIELPKDLEEQIIAAIGPHPRDVAEAEPAPPKSDVDVVREQIAAHIFGVMAEKIEEKKP